MKAFIHIAAWVLFAGVTARALPLVKQNAKAVAAAPYLQVQHAYLCVLQDLGACMTTVQDKNSADAAAATVCALNERLVALSKEVQNLPPAPKSVRSYILQQCDIELNREIAESGVGKALELMMSCDAPCYGSAALEQALGELLQTLCGADL